LNLDEQVVGVTDYCNFPAKAKTKPKVGGYYNPSLEKVISLKPNLLVTTADGYNKPIIDKLTSLGVPCFVFNAQSMGQILKDILTLGDLTDRQERAIEYVEKLQERLSKVEKKVNLIPQNKRLKVFYGLNSDPLWTSGPDTFIHDLINKAGGVNVAADANGSWVKYSLETLIAKKPDVIITGKGESQKNEEATAPWLKYTSLPAVVNGKIYAINIDWLSRPGPRLIDALEAVYALLYEQKGIAK
jgi:iron complex transport system substrate-binding protein